MRRQAQSTGEADQPLGAAVDVAAGREQRPMAWQPVADEVECIQGIVIALIGGERSDDAVHERVRLEIQPASRRLTIDHRAGERRQIDSIVDQQRSLLREISRPYGAPLSIARELPTARSAAR